MTTFRLARSPTANLSGALSSFGSLGYAAPPPSGGGLPSWLNFGTQIDEQLMYDNVLDWIWAPADKNTNFATTPPSDIATIGHGRGGGTVHDFSEADDLWNHYVQYLRTKDSNLPAAAIYRAWAQSWRNYFVTGTYVNGLGSMIDGGATGGGKCTDLR